MPSKQLVQVTLSHTVDPCLDDDACTLVLAPPVVQLRRRKLMQKHRLRGETPSHRGTHLAESRWMSLDLGWISAGSRLDLVALLGLQSHRLGMRNRHGPKKHHCLHERWAQAAGRWPLVAGRRSPGAEEHQRLPHPSRPQGHLKQPRKVPTGAGWISLELRRRQVLWSGNHYNSLFRASWQPPRR